MDSDARLSEDAGEKLAGQVQALGGEVHLQPPSGRRDHRPGLLGGRPTVCAGGCALGGYSAPPAPRPALCPGRTPDQPPPTSRRVCAVHLEVPDRAVPTAANIKRLPCTGRWGGPPGEPPRADVGFLSSCAWAGLPSGCRAAQSQQLLLRQRGISARRILGRARPQPSQRMCGDPRAHVGWPDLAPLAAFQCPWPPTHVVSQQARPLPPPGLSQWPHHCVRGQSRARAQEGTVWGQRDQSFQSWATWSAVSLMPSCALLRGPGLCCRSRAPSTSLRH